MVQRRQGEASGQEFCYVAETKGSLAKSTNLPFMVAIETAVHNTSQSKYDLTIN